MTPPAVTPDPLKAALTELAAAQQERDALEKALQRILADVIEPCQQRSPARCRWCYVVSQRGRIEHLEWCPSAIAEDALARRKRDA